MTRIYSKAHRLYTEGAVTVDLWRAKDGNVERASGHVYSGKKLYWVTVSPDGDSCSCRYGVTRPGKQHSHTLALRLAAAEEARE